MIQMMVHKLDDQQPSQGEKSVALEELIHPEELARFRAELAKSHAQAEAGELIPIEEVLDEL